MWITVMPMVISHTTIFRGSKPFPSSERTRVGISFLRMMDTRGVYNEGERDSPQETSEVQVEEYPIQVHHQDSTHRSQITSLVRVLWFQG